MPPVNIVENLPSVSNCLNEETTMNSTLIYLCLGLRKETLANSVDFDQNAVPDRSLNCLHSEQKFL